MARVFCVMAYAFRVMAYVFRVMAYTFRVMAGEGQPPTTLQRGTRESRGWPAFVGHDTEGACHDTEGACHVAEGQSLRRLA